MEATRVPVYLNMRTLWADSKWIPPRFLSKVATLVSLALQEANQVAMQRLRSGKLLWMIRVCVIYSAIVLCCLTRHGLPA